MRTIVLCMYLRTSNMHKVHLLNEKEKSEIEPFQERSGSTYLADLFEHNRL